MQFLYNPSGVGRDRAEAHRGLRPRLLTFIPFGDGPVMLTRSGDARSGGSGLRQVVFLASHRHPIVPGVRRARGMDRSSG